jgi:predicted methyltransferase
MSALAFCSLGAVAACTGEQRPKDVAPPQSAEERTLERGSLEWAIAGPWRIDPERDEWRHPAETLRFWGLEPGMTVIEVFPGRGWYTAILAPYLAENEGKLIAASFDPANATQAQADTLAYFRERFTVHPEVFGAIEMAVMSPTSAEIAAPGSADLVVLTRNVHTLLGAGYAEKAFEDFYAALKPGGILGIEQHRAASSGLQDPQAGDGYVQEAFVKLLAVEAGFEFVGSSEINANPADTRDHPFGVWTLPPSLLTAPVGMPPDPNFDTSPYSAIGESDRMTLKFRKPE